MAGIYIHIPYCKQACYYCDFHFSTSQRTLPAMIDAICQELNLQKDYLPGKPSLQSIYFGGGTPSLLSPLHLERILNTIYKLHHVETDAEVTLEANPDDLSLEKLQSFYQLGINRLSIGIQSFQDDVLRQLHRAHSAKQAIEAVRQAQAVGFRHISIDLIYGIPGVSHNRWLKDIEQALALQVGHISAYCLTIEEKTVFGRWYQKGKLTPTDDAVAAAQMALLIERLEAAGFVHYEISNFALPGQFARHNSSYWKQLPYLGVGPAAHSYDGHSRQANIANNALYIKSIAAGKVPAQGEVLSPQDHANELLLTGLRTIWGCSLSRIRQYLTPRQWDGLQQEIARYVAEGYLQLENDTLRLTKKGKFIADSILEALFVVD
ncbi:radical SAM family heme chaperone HemW [Thermonema rossianum]|uniref:radical SAM family heme chaperone HemW n=1 Tax=Thermonema rossianum TaxID=55505 RepID=UPI00056F6B35|nr:radical SAM family heme chaperone HemW [Thermonema rossianum]